MIENTVVKSLADMLKGGHAHTSFENAVEGIPLNLLDKKVSDLPYTIWQLVEHIRIAQWDILEFSRNKNHKSPAWPEEFWPAEEGPAHGTEWEKSINRIKEDRDAFIHLLDDPENDLYKPFSYGDGQTLFREALLIGDHTSYHTGEIVLIRRLLNCW